MRTKIAINGFGRIGRIAFRLALTEYRDKVEVVAINTSGSMDPEGWANLVKYDSVYRQFSLPVGVGEAQGPREVGSLLIDSILYPLLAERDPQSIPWYVYKPEVVIESTGAFRTSEGAGKHISAGAKKVLISAPPKGSDVPIFLIGINDSKYSGETIVSNGSCTTNCVAPIVKLMDEKFGIEQAVLTTIHAYTADQELVDGSHKDLRRARAAALSIIPTETGAAESVIAVFPSLKGKFAGTAIRVPVAAGSYSDLTFKIREKADYDKVNSVFLKAAEGKMGNILKVTTDPIVSTDVIGNPASCIVDLGMTTIVGEDMVQIGAWYDNEWGYASRLLELAIRMGE